MKLGVLSKKPIKVILWVALFGFVLEFVGYYSGFQLSDIIYYHLSYVKKKQSFEGEYGIYFRENLKSQDYPNRWTSNPVLANQTRVENIDDVYDPAICFRVIAGEIKKLPLKNNNYFNYFSCLNDLVIMGNPSGGTYSSELKSIYIVIRNSSNNRSSKSRIKLAFYHELSSLLKENYSFDENIWRATHGDDFQYEIDSNPMYGWMYLNGHVDSVDEQTLFNRGLLRQYAETGVENDFNTYAELIFTDPYKMKKLINEYPVIQRKYQVFKDFYLSIDPAFSHVFEKIDG